MRKSGYSWVLGTVVACIAMAGCAAGSGSADEAGSNGPMPSQEYLLGDWSCTAGDEESSTDITFDVSADTITAQITYNGETFEYDYGYTLEDGVLTTDDGNGSGWTIEGPTEIEDDADFDVVLTDAGGTQMPLNLSFAGESIQIDGLWEGTARCARGADGVPPVETGAAAGPGPDLECTDSTIDQEVCDDLNEMIDASSGGDLPCELADGSAVYTPAFAEVADRPVRCMVPAEAELFTELEARGIQIDGVGDLGTEGSSDHNIFYLAWGSECGGEPTYWPATDSWSQYKSTSPSLTDERFATPADVMAAICDR